MWDTTVDVSSASAKNTDATATTASFAVSVMIADRDACGELVRRDFTGTWALEKRGGEWLAVRTSMNPPPGRKLVTDSGECESQARPEQVCYPGFSLPAVRLPGLPEYGIPAVTIPAEEIEAECFDAPSAFAIGKTTVRMRNYEDIDQSYSPRLSRRYWRRSGGSSLTPDPFADGFGELNGAGFPKNQYVRPYFRRDGTYVDGHWRNSPGDGLPTCRVISC